MNEQIKQLSKQCYETGPIGKDGWPEYSRLNEVKFAELIIKECIKLNSKELSITAIERLLPLYEEHFGIEL